MSRRVENFVLDVIGLVKDGGTFVHLVRWKQEWQDVVTATLEAMIVGWVLFG